jgi:hypothetical protein
LTPLIAELDGLDDRPEGHPFRSVVIGQMGPYIPYPSHSTLSNLGPQMWTLMLDCRYVIYYACLCSVKHVLFSAERRIDQVCSEVEYRKVFERLRYIPQGVEQLIVQLGLFD